MKIARKDIWYWNSKVEVSAADLSEPRNIDDTGFSGQNIHQTRIT
jgi:hypothetical protein